jgi:hypothetical protein
MWECYHLASLTGLEGLRSIGGDLTLTEEIALNDLGALNHLNSIGGNLRLEFCYQLTSLAGLDSIAPNSINDLTIANNNSLAECDVKSICDYLAGPNGTVTISYNAPGCNNQQEVWLECTVEVPESVQGPELLIYPNPSEKEINIIAGAKTNINAISIYNQLGQKVLYEEHPATKIDVSFLRPGIYIVECVIDNIIGREKLIISR